ncbi:hypothetical protein [Mycobacterium intracellulare]|uniref:hypothetical protein n=1 Tax=Mycobacterium intracellulare TaxID=1767 RepID=UPI00080BAB14|nr:hypothetical protein [Mycobacterium intracellulare]OCB22533.1 hypothetical protein A5689_17460 [Mycobacterium intracellulare subsp. yongonense]
METVLHVCEVCQTEAVLTPGEAYDAGWDYPPRMGTFGVISPRTCPDCPINRTVWWAIAADGYTEDMLNRQQLATIRRILAEPESVAPSAAEE